MTVLHCQQKPLKHLHQSVTPPEPPPAGNPLGPQHGNIDFIDRQSFAVSSTRH